MKKNKLPKKNLVLLLCSAVLLIINIVFYSLGWFTFNTETQADGMGMKATDCPFEIITRGGEYSEDVPGHDLLKKIDAFDLGNVNVEKTENETGEYSVVVGEETQTEFAYSMNWLLKDDSNFNNNTTNEEGDDYGLRPGSHGRLEFYIKPVEDKMPMTIVCELAITPYQIKEVTTTENDVTKIETIYQQIDNNSGSSRVIDFLKGHILFFKNYDDTNKVYENPISINENGNVQFEVDVNAETINTDKEVKVELYWIWPRTLPELLLDSDDPNLLGRQNLLANITDNADDTSAKKIIVDIMKSKSTYFFPQGTTITADLIDKISQNGEYQKSDYIDLCSAYNQVDQYIGLNVQFVVLNLTCSVK